MRQSTTLISGNQSDVHLGDAPVSVLSDIALWLCEVHVALSQSPCPRLSRKNAETKALQNHIVVEMICGPRREVPRDLKNVWPRS